VVQVRKQAEYVDLAGAVQEGRRLVASLRSLVGRTDRLASVAPTVAVVAVGHALDVVVTRPSCVEGRRASLGGPLTGDGRISDMAPEAVLPLRALVDAHRDEIKAIVARNNGTAVALFGSVARGEETVESDIDLLVDTAPGTSLMHLGVMLMDLRDLLGPNVDVMSTDALDERDDDIRADAIPL